MNPQGLTQQPNIEGMSSQIQEKLNSLRQLPPELVGKIPESVWTSLTADHRAEMLKQYGIYEKYLQLEIKAQQNIDHTVNVVEQGMTTEVSLDQLNSLQGNQQHQSQQTQQKPLVVDVTKTTEIKGKTQFAEAVVEKDRIEASNVEQINKIDTSEEQERTKSSSEGSSAKRMQMENPQSIINNRNSQVQEKVVPKFSGYPIAENIPSNVDHIEEHGNPRDGSTWTASFIKKIWAIFTN